MLTLNVWRLHFMFALFWRNEWPPDWLDSSQCSAPAQRVENGDPITAETEEVAAASSEFQFNIHLFAKLLPKMLKRTCIDPTFGMVLYLVLMSSITESISVKYIVAKKRASKIFSSLPATRNKIQGAYNIIVEHNDKRLKYDKTFRYLCSPCSTSTLAKRHE